MPCRQRSSDLMGRKLPKTRNLIVTGATGCKESPEPSPRSSVEPPVALAAHRSKENHRIARGFASGRTASALVGQPARHGPSSGRGGFHLRVSSKIVWAA